jgi:hypothetical protein
VLEVATAAFAVGRAESAFQTRDSTAISRTLLFANRAPFPVKAVYVTHLQESIFRLKPEGLKNMLASNRRGFFGEPDSSPGLWARQHSIELVHHQIFRENFGKLFGGHGFERMRGVALGT